MFQEPSLHTRSVCLCVSFLCPRNNTYSQHTQPFYLILQYHFICRPRRDKSMAASSSKGGGGSSNSSSIYPASFIKRNLVPGADSYRQTLAELRDMDKVSHIGVIRGLTRKWARSLGRKRGEHRRTGKRVGSRHDGPNRREKTP